MEFSRELTWRKSTRSGAAGHCVEAAFLPGGTGVAVRDSKNPGDGVQTFDAQDWRDFTDGVKDGEFDF